MGLQMSLKPSFGRFFFFPRWLRDHDLGGAKSPAAWAVRRPMVPPPMTTTRSPLLTPPLWTAWTATAVGSTMAPSSSFIVLGSLMTRSRGTTSFSQKHPPAPDAHKLELRAVNQPPLLAGRTFATAHFGKDRHLSLFSTRTSWGPEDLSMYSCPGMRG